MANSFLSNALYLCCQESRCLLKKALGVKKPSIFYCSTAPTTSDEASAVSMVVVSGTACASRAMSARLVFIELSFLCPLQWLRRRLLLPLQTIERSEGICSMNDEPLVVINNTEEFQ